MHLPAYAALFLVAFGAATLLPLQSEAVLAGLLAYGQHSTFWLIVVATAGNVLGSAANWLLGRYIERWHDRRWFPVSPERLAAAQRHYRRFGHWSLLLSWAPLIGDPLTLVAGIMREPLPRFLLLVLLAKLARYLVVAAVTLGIAA